MRCLRGKTGGAKGSALSRAHYRGASRGLSIVRKDCCTHIVLNISMNVTQLQQPPPQSGPTRSASEAEDVTPDVCGLPMAWNHYTQTFLAVLVDKTGQ
jgi:hypothetical protein